MRSSAKQKLFFVEKTKIENQKIARIKNLKVQSSGNKKVGCNADEVSMADRSMRLCSKIMRNGSAFSPSLYDASSSMKRLIHVSLTIGRSVRPCNQSRLESRTEQ